MILNGIHWRNVRAMADDAFEIAQHFGAFVVMSNLGPELPREIRKRFPDALIIVRLYWPAGDLPSHGEAFGEWLEYMDEVGSAVTHYQILNETDLEYPNVTPESCAEWFMVAQGGLKSQHPNKRYGFPMPSVRGQAAMDYTYRCGEAIAQADWIAEHCYWQEAWQMDDRYWGSRYYSVHESWPGKELHITEFGCSADLDVDTRATAYRGYLRTLPEYIGSASVFIMAGTKDWALFSVDEAMAKAMKPAAGMVTGSHPSVTGPDGLLSDSHDAESEGKMTEYNRAVLWQDYQVAKEGAPALRKHADSLNWETALGPERAYGQYTVQFFAEGVIYCKTGDWGNVDHATEKDQLPLA